MDFFAEWWLLGLVLWGSVKLQLRTLFHRILVADLQVWCLCHEFLTGCCGWRLVWVLVSFKACIFLWCSGVALREIETISWNVCSWIMFTTKICIFDDQRSRKNIMPPCQGVESLYCNDENLDCGSGRPVLLILAFLHNNSMFLLLLALVVASIRQRQRQVLLPDRVIGKLKWDNPYKEFWKMHGKF